MPEPRSISFKPEGAEAAVDVPLPEGYATPEELETGYVPRAQVEARIREASRTATNGLMSLEDATASEAVRKAVADQHADWFRETLSIEPGKGVDVDKLREQIRTDEVTPLQTTIEAQGTEIQSLRTRWRDGDIHAAMGTHGLKAQFRPLALAMARERMRWAEDHKGWFVGVDGKPDEFVYATKPEQGQAPFQEADEFFQQLRSSGDYPDWWDSTMKPGSGYQGGSGLPSDMNLEAFQKLSDVERTEFHRKDPDTWRKLMAELRKANEAAYLKQGAV